MPSILDAVPFPFHLPIAQAIERTLYTFIYRTGPIEAILQHARINCATIPLDLPAYLLWHKILENAANQGKTRALLEAVREEPAYGVAVAQRLDEILGPVPVIEAGGAGPVVWRNPQALTGERNQFVSAKFLERGAQLATSVVRVEVSDSLQVSVGTGFLIKSDVVLTNYHVLYPNGKRATKVTVRFDYDLNLDTSPTPYTEVGAAAATIDGDPTYDWAVVRLINPTTRSAIEFAPASVAAGDRAYIIQHPAGGPKMVVIHENLVRFADGEVVQYLTDTLPGSSGAPVLNSKWQLIALHRQAICVNVGSTREVRNEGIAIGRVRDGLLERGILP